MIRANARLAELFETDQTAWQEAMAECIQRSAFEELDYPHLGVFLAEWAARDRREVETRLAALIAQVLKWDYQPTLRAKGWGFTILEEQHELEGMFDSPTLRAYAEANLEKVYKKSVKLAAHELGLSEDDFPAKCSYQLAELLEFDVLGDGD